MRISDWSSDVCSSDLPRTRLGQAIACDLFHAHEVGQEARLDLGAAKAVDHPRRHIVDRDIGAGRGSALDRKSDVEGKSVSVRVALGGRRFINKKRHTKE